MREFYAYDLISGRITKTGVLLYGFSPDISRKHKIIFGQKTDNNFYHNLETDKLEPRPLLEVDNTTLEVDQEFNLPNIPEGTTIYVDGDNIGVVDNTGLTLIFPVAKSYEVKLIPPFPYFEKTIIVEVV